jgi:hypothetical protein
MATQKLVIASLLKLMRISYFKALIRTAIGAYALYMTKRFKYGTQRAQAFAEIGNCFSPQADENFLFQGTYRNQLLERMPYTRQNDSDMVTPKLVIVICLS